MADLEIIPGVNIQLGDGVSQALYEASKLTQVNCSRLDFVPRASAFAEMALPDLT
jgi:hypothetical protein